MPDLPTTARTPVYHVGDLDQDRPTPYYSNEGDGLSVSEHARDWAQIMRGGGTIYELRHPDTPEFYAADPTSPRDRVIEWCIDHDYVERVPVYRAEWPDPETGDTQYLLEYDRETAVIEGQVDVRADATITETTGLALADRGRAYWAEAFQMSPADADPLEVRELTPVWYAQDHDCVGVWWDERHDPANYSAPRGCIFQARLDEWEIVATGEV